MKTLEEALIRIKELEATRDLLIEENVKLRTQLGEPNNTKKQIKAYRIKHIPTGLYFTPSRYLASQLSLKGKVYHGTATTRRLPNVITVYKRSYEKRSVWRLLEKAGISLKEGKNDLRVSPEHWAIEFI